MALTFYDSWRKVSSTPSEYWSESLQALIDEQFENASNIYTIEEETTRGTMTFTNLTCRICHVLTDKQTGEKLGDDFKELIFKNMDYDVFIGKRFRFDDNIFICTNTDNYHYVTKSCIIRRCNNSLRWIDDYGNKNQEPCICDYKILNDSNDYNANIITPQGAIDNITLQYNDKSKNINPNQRFLIGNPRVCYKIKGNGINNYLNEKTFDDNSVQLTKINVVYDPINKATDDIINGYANAYQTNYTISIDQGLSLEQNVGYTSSLSTTVKLNNEVVNGMELLWESSDSDICEIEPNGTFILKNIGDCTITVSLKNNPSVSDIMNISVKAIPSDSYEIRISPNVTEIAQGDFQNYDVNLYKNGIQQSDAVTITASGVPSTYYKLTTSANGFLVANIKQYSPSPLTVNCTSGSYNTSIQIDLIGW